MVSLFFGSKQHPKAVSWWEPRWSFAPRTLRELRAAFPAAACVRILIASAVAAAAVFGVVEVFVRPGLPALQFNWIAAFAQGVGRTAAYIACMTCLWLAIPPWITVSHRGVLQQVGQIARFFKRQDIRSVHVVLRRDGRHFIRIEKAKGAMRLGLSRKVSLLALAEHFGNQLVVHDRRRGNETLARPMAVDSLAAEDRG